MEERVVEIVECSTCKEETRHNVSYIEYEDNVIREQECTQCGWINA